MTDVGVLLTATVAFVGAVSVVVAEWSQPRPPLGRVLTHLRRAGPRVDELDPDQPLGARGAVAQVGRWVIAGPAGPRTDSWRVAMRLLGRPLDAHVGGLVAASVVGFLVPSLILASLRAAGANASIVLPLAVSLAVALILPAMLHAHAMSLADEVRVDLRHQLSAYFDMVTMLLAGNTGHETALSQAAGTGDGLLFAELRRRMREANTRGRSHITALEVVGDDFDLDELRQFAAAASLTAAEGAPVARTLAAKCATLRSTMAAEQEAKARVRNDKITPPLVGMALLFMVLIIYPALQLG